MTTRTAPHPAGRTERVGLWSFRHRRLVVVLAVGLLLALSAAASTLGGEFRQSFALPGSQTQAASDRLDAAGFDLGGQTGLAVLSTPDVTDPEARQAFASFLTAVGQRAAVSVTDPYQPRGAHQISADGAVAYAALDFGDVPRSDADEAAAQVREIRDRTVLPGDAALELGGDLFFEEAPFSSEAFGLLAAAVILLLAFGSLLAMGLPIATALIGVGCAFAVVQLATHLLAIPPFTPGVIAMIGLGAGIDYALLVVTRYREELGAGSPPEAAVRRAMSTAGRSTVFAGATVVTSLLGLLLVGLDDVRALGLAAAAGVLFVMLASVTLLPALLGFAGTQVDRLGLPHRRRHGRRDVTSSGWYRWSRAVQRRPITAVVLSVLALLAVASPVTDMRLGMTDASVRPDSDTSRRAHDLVASGFGPGANGPLFIAVNLTGPSALDRAADVVRTHPAVQDVVAMPSEDGGTGLVVATPATGPADARTSRLVERLRTDTLPDASLDALVGGPTAAAVDFADHNARVLPWFLTAVLAASFLLLLVVFRSLLVPLKAVLVNLLTVGAAYGVVVAVFQWGWLTGPIAGGQPGPIEAWVPMMLFAIVFGLSMDYEVFLISRIRERYLVTGDNSHAVAYGLAHTARLITAAAAIMVCVFGAFALSDERALQMLGVGLAAALILDATLVRLVLVPATMQLAGRWNWWLPEPLARHLPAGPPGHSEPSRPAPIHVGATSS